MFYYSLGVKLLNRWMEWFGLRLSRVPKAQRYALDAEMEEALQALARQQQRSPEEVAANLVATGLASESARGQVWRQWRSLSAREQQVAAMTCLGYTNLQIAARLFLSVETVRSYSRNMQRKFNVNSKADLRVLLADWDFSAWE